jgi:hypothetical protein
MPSSDLEDLLAYRHLCPAEHQIRKSDDLLDTWCRCPAATWKTCWRTVTFVQQSIRSENLMTCWTPGVDAQQ